MPTNPLPVFSNFHNGFINPYVFALLGFRMCKVAPQIMPFVFGDEPSNTDDSIGVQCMVNKGDLPIEIRWIINSSPIISGENGITITKLNARTSSLNINSLDGIHRGVYKCIGINAAGTAEYSATLEVNGL